jgi:hypothetical protein
MFDGGNGADALRFAHRNSKMMLRPETDFEPKQKADDR